MEKTHHINTSQKKAGAVILISIKNKKYHYGWGKNFNDKGVNSLRGHSGPKYVCTWQ